MQKNQTTKKGPSEWGGGGSGKELKTRRIDATPTPEVGGKIKTGKKRLDPLNGPHKYH